SIRFTVIDDSVEYDLYTEPFPIDSVSAEFQEPFYLIANLAIGGLFTDADYLGGNGLPISMPFPAHMYVDYIKVMEWNGQGEVHIGPPTFQEGTFGLFTDTTPIDNGLVVGEDAEIYVWEGTLSEGTIPPYEGENGISWQTTGLGWFGAGIMSMQPVNLFNFGEGYLKFMIKIPANISFQIGIIDTWGNQSYVEFPANQTTYGLVRDGNWGQASIPVEDIRGEWIDLRMLSYEFVILEVNGASCEFGLDDIYWDDGVTNNIIEDEFSGAPIKYSLNNNYPNPFNPLTTIHYDLPEDGFVNVTIYDMMGRTIKIMVNKEQNAGVKSVQWDATDSSGKPVSAGLYLYTIQAGEFKQTKKMVLLK
ncbi:MAG: T9SS type A sorting domain-containing protein, partial [Candidatus Marinimicrobia bacterium]|nr:T9SS type A sorting domain-containing protein [Candidatus Neomarinimicrobiota bacterium]